jgi:hypothetical protein
MLAQADIARAGKDKPTGEVVEAISQPPRGPRVDDSDAGGRSDVRRGGSRPAEQGNVDPR